MTDQTYAGLILETDYATGQHARGYGFTKSTWAVRCAHGTLIPIDPCSGLPAQANDRKDQCPTCELQRAEGAEQDRAIRALLKTMGRPRKHAAARGIEAAA